MAKNSKIDDALLPELFYGDARAESTNIPTGCSTTCAAYDCLTAQKPESPTPPRRYMTGGLPQKPAYFEKPSGSTKMGIELVEGQSLVRWTKPYYCAPPRVPSGRLIYRRSDDGFHVTHALRQMERSSFDKFAEGTRSAIRPSGWSTSGGSRVGVFCVFRPNDMRATRAARTNDDRVYVISRGTGTLVTGGTILGTVQAAVRPKFRVRANASTAACRAT